MRLHWLLVCLIVLLGVWLRFFDLGILPNGLHWDEMDTGYQAYSLIRTGRDYFGNPLPLFFHSLADFRTPILLYLSAVPVQLLGLSPVSVRLVSATLGSLSLISFYLLARLMFRKPVVGIFATLTACLSPWLVQYSRQGVESMTMVTLLLLSLSTWYRGWYKSSALLFGLSMAAYSPAKLFVPLLVGFLVYKYRPKLSLITCALFLVPCALIITDGLVGASGTRFRQLSIFNDPTVETEINYQRETQELSGGISKTLGMQPRFIDKFVYNKPGIWLNTFAKNYLSAFSTDFLFLKGDQELRHSPSRGSLGMLLLPEFIPLSLAILLLEPVLIFWLIIGPLGASLTIGGNPHAARLSLWAPVLLLLVARGSHFLYQKSKLLFLGYSVIFIFFAVSYYAYFFANYRWESAQPFQYGFSQVITWGLAQPGNVILDMGEHNGLMAYLFTAKYSPALFQIKAKNLQEEIFPGIYAARFGPLSITIPGTRSWLDTKVPPNTSLAVYSAQPHAIDIPGRVGELDYPDTLPAFYFAKSY